MITVTVNTVSKSVEGALLELLRTRVGVDDLAYDGPPRRLTGGFWATLIAFRLAHAPDSLAGPLVARVMPNPAVAAKETIIQRQVAADGFPTPTVHLSGGPDDGLGEAFLVMDLADGHPLLGGLNGAVAITALPTLARRLPTVLGDTMAQLHRLDPEPVRRQLAHANVGSVGVDAVLDGYLLAAEHCDRDDLRTATAWLISHRPPTATEVVCHGDLHPFNVLVTDAGEVTVLDWSAALLASPAYDVAFTGLLLAEPPIRLPRPLQPMIRAAGRWLARRFRRQYERTAGAVDDAELRWHQGVVCLRALTESAYWEAAGELDGKAGHPWLVNGAAFAQLLSDITSQPVRAAGTLR